jgi:hypothetical protein
MVQCRLVVRSIGRLLGTLGCVTYDSGLASFFSQNNVDDNHHPSRQVQYVGVLKDILQLDYGTMSTPIVLF